MLDTDLTSISTNGWFVENSIIEQLTPVSVFGWWYDLSEITPEEFRNIYNLSLLLGKSLILELER